MLYFYMESLMRSFLLSVKTYFFKSLFFSTFLTVVFSIGDNPNSQTKMEDKVTPRIILVRNEGVPNIVQSK